MLAADAVALVEAARQVPGDVGAELAQQENGERGGGDPVDVVVAVDADPAALLDGGADLRARSFHVAEEERVVRRLLAVEEAARVGGIGVAAPDEHGGGQLGDAERAGELRLGGGRAVGECPGAVVHVQPSYGDGRTESVPGACPDWTAVDGVARGFRDEAATLASPLEPARFAGPRVGGGLGWSRYKRAYARAARPAPRAPVRPALVRDPDPERREQDEHAEADQPVRQHAPRVPRLAERAESRPSPRGARGRRKAATSDDDYGGEKDRLLGRPGEQPRGQRDERQHRPQAPPR